jgi:hypothetical protein
MLQKQLRLHPSSNSESSGTRTEAVNLIEVIARRFRTLDESRQNNATVQCEFFDFLNSLCTFREEGITMNQIEIFNISRSDLQHHFFAQLDIKKLKIRLLQESAEE